MRRSSGRTCWPRRSPVSAPRPRWRRTARCSRASSQPDDAAVYRVGDDLAIIGTLDFFPPLVDDPRTFGEIAAANALSDVFAMGGRVLFALSIAAFPEELPREVMTEIFAGASSKVREAGGTLAGGHTIRDPEPKYGLAVIGAAHPGPPAAQGRRPAGRPARADQAARDRRSSCPGRARAGRAKRTSRSRSTACGRSTGPPPRRSSRHGIAAATDVTGFGLLGHGLEMARASGTRFVFESAALPILPGARDLAAAGIETGGAAHNRRFVAGSLGPARTYRPSSSHSPTIPRPPAACSRRSPPTAVAPLERAFEAAGVERWWIGAVEPGEPGVRLD